MLHIERNDRGNFGQGTTFIVRVDKGGIEHDQDHRVHEEFAEEGMMDSDVGYPDLIPVAPTCASFKDALKRVTSIFRL